MNPVSLEDIQKFVSENIGSFHQGRLNAISALNLRRLLLRKNPYLYRAKNITLVQNFVESLLTAHLSSSEEEFFGQFLERLAIFISSITRGGFKSERNGVDLEFIADDTYHVVQIKSGPNWGNSSQTRRLAHELEIAKQHFISQGHLNVRAVLGICYGKAKTTGWKDVADKVVGQNFWMLISGRPDLYTEIIEPLGYEARQHSEAFERERDRISNRLVEGFLRDFCDDGAINWQRIVEFNSKNLDS